MQMHIFFLPFKIDWAQMAIHKSCYTMQNSPPKKKTLYNVTVMSACLSILKPGMLAVFANGLQSYNIY